MPISNKPWSDFTAADYSPEEYCAASLIDENPSGERKTKDRCRLPVREPGGSLNRAAVHAAAAVLAGGRGGVDAPPAKKRAAARRLLTFYGELDEEPPESLRRLAR